MPKTQDGQFQFVDDVIDVKAKSDGSYAIAWAILQLAKSTDGLTNSIHKLGTGNAATDMGAIEAHSMSVKEVAEALEQGLHAIAEKLDN